MNQNKVKNQLSQLKRTLISLVDFEHCNGIAKHILDNKLHELYTHNNRYLLEGLSLAMIIAYCRPFSGNKDCDLPGRFVKSLSEDEKKTHLLALQMRNKILAHSDNKFWEMSPHYIELENNERVLFPFHNCVQENVSKPYTKKLMLLSKKQLEQCIDFKKILEGDVSEHIPTFKM